VAGQSLPASLFSSCFCLFIVFRSIVVYLSAAMPELGVRFDEIFAFKCYDWRRGDHNGTSQSRCGPSKACLAALAPAFGVGA
jgi:hypothetical protein